MTKDYIKQLKNKIAMLEDELVIYKTKYREEVDNNEYKKKYRELVDANMDQRMKQKSMTELNFDGNETRGRYGEDESRLAN
mgnify:FL=1|tara:strand:+ start:583 stop:825 length:243 start_codon:yes stop_codon:yes gene_type:complete